ncbi:MAG TPA: class C beta-lactamase-related serine hydrolase [Deltaproteobacteria bacterium]|nr:class C beta-lactamase-related serine hydrolase [Deltaproteobacteria bacterium]
MSVQSRSFRCGWIYYPIFLCILITLLLLLPTACRSNVESSLGIKYTPLQASDLKVSTPAEQGLDPALVGKLYANAAQLETIYSLLVLKNGYLVAEGYFNGGAVYQANPLQSVTKSYTSALVGVALNQGCLSSLDQKMIDFFPEFKSRIKDPRKKRITIRNMLQMRSGYPWEARTPPYFDILFSQGWRWLPHLLDFPLTSEPGTRFAYSNLTSHLLAVILARACSKDLKPWAQKHLFSLINAKVAKWGHDWDNYRWGCVEIYFTPRDMAKFGLLYLNHGRYQGKQVLPASWIRQSLKSYSRNIRFVKWGPSKLGRYFRDIGYGYQWWSAKVGKHHVNFAWGHGGNLIVLVHNLNMVIACTANPLYGIHGEESWQYEGAIIDVVGEFIRSLPSSKHGPGKPVK